MESDAPSSAIVSIEGDLIALGPLRREHLNERVRWVNDFEYMLGMGRPRPQTLEQVVEGFERGTKATDEVYFTIYVRADMRPIGTILLRDIDYRNQRAELVIGIGARDCWGRGYGTEATRLTLDYGFTMLGLHNIMLKVYAFNERAIRAYQRAGFREIGRRREAHRIGGGAYDVVYMDCLAAEFESPVLRRLLPAK